MVWIYGGNLQFGGSTDVGYNGSSFAANQDVIIVNFNYRTNGESLAPTTDEHQLIPYSFWFPRLTRAAIQSTKSRLPGPALCSSMGSTEHQGFRW